MNLIVESPNFNDYLLELDVVNYTHPLVTEVIDKLFREDQTELEKVKIAFEFVRDRISHSWDIQSTNVTCKASDVVAFKEGICYAKANLLAALLRSQTIPIGFCYQRLMLFDTPDKGYCLHALNGVFLSSFNKWIRLDARGNKANVQAEFSIAEEKVAFPIQEKFDERDYPTIYYRPNPKTIATLKEQTNAIKMYQSQLPDLL